VQRGGKLCKVEGGRSVNENEAPVLFVHACVGVDGKGLRRSCKLRLEDAVVWWHGGKKMTGC
jgi:hypothetical protein